MPCITATLGFMIIVIGYLFFVDSPGILNLYA